MRARSASESGAIAAVKPDGAGAVVVASVVAGAVGVLLVVVTVVVVASASRRGATVESRLQAVTSSPAATSP
jgi:hypothetical protein